MENYCLGLSRVDQAIAHETGIARGWSQAQDQPYETFLIGCQKCGCCTQLNVTSEMFASAEFPIEDAVEARVTQEFEQAHGNQCEYYARYLNLKKSERDAIDLSVIANMIK